MTIFRIRCTLLLLPGLLVPALSLIAQEEAAVAPGISSSTELFLQMSTRPELKAGVIQSFTLPFLRGNGPLTAGNSIALAFTAEATPISANGIAEIVWTPAAFFQAVAGSRLGMGWNIALGKGAGINELQSDGTGVFRGGSFEGIFWGVYGGGVLQFDLGAVLPGDWSHLVARSYHEIRYRAYTGASGRESWVYEDDAGENRNGPAYYGSYLLGYRMPLLLDTVALMAEMDLFLYDTPGRSRWGDDLGAWTFSVMTNFTFSPRISAAFLVQFRTLRNYIDESLFYQRRQLDGSSPRLLEFYRVAAVLTYRLR